MNSWPVLSRGERDERDENDSARRWERCPSDKLKSAQFSVRKQN